MSSGRAGTARLAALAALAAALALGLLAPPAHPVATPRSGARGVAHLGDPVIRLGQALARAHLRYRPGQYVELVAARTVSFVEPAGARLRLVPDGIPSELAGPEPAGSPAGSVSILADSRLLGRVPLVTARAVAPASLGQRLRDYFSRTLTLASLAALVGCSLLLAVLRRRVTRRRTGSAGPGMGPETA